MKKVAPKILLFIIIAALVYLFFAFDLANRFTLSNLKAKQEAFQTYYAEHKFLTLGMYMGIYILVTALSLPGAAVMSLAGGALFGLVNGVIVVSFASTIGATLAFLVSRFLMGNYVQEKFGDKLTAINKGIEKDGPFYLFTLRLVPVFPFFVINLAMGLTKLRTFTFFWVSQIGMFPGTVVYLNAGTQLGRIDSLSGILSPSIVLSFALLGLFPLFAKKATEFIKSKKIYAGYKKPKGYDYNLVVIGAGSAGLVSAYIASAVKAKTAIIEKSKMGGDCLNTGCVPSKALIKSAKILSDAARSQKYGIEKMEASFHFSGVMKRIHNVISKIEPHDSAERYASLGVECIQGEARIIDPFRVEVNGKVLTTKNIVIASGAEPFIPPIPGLLDIDYLTSDNIWNLRELPNRLVVLGGGPIGSELAQAFARLGSRVTQVEMMDRILLREDKDVSEAITNRFKEEGISVLAGHRAERIIVEGHEKVLICDDKGKKIRIPFDQILVAVGRAARIKGFGLEDIGVRITDRKTIEVNHLMQTNFPNIYCAGDCAGPYQFTHTASHQAWYAAVNALFGKFKTFSVDYRVIPWCTFTDPEVARVGLNEREASEQGIAYETTIYHIDDLDRAIADGSDHGFVRVLTKPGADTILGVTIVGPHAGEIISEFVLAMKYNLGLNKILGTIHIYPTFSEANKYAAGNWKKAHAPEKILAWLKKYHVWMRK